MNWVVNPFLVFLLIWVTGLSVYSVGIADFLHPDQTVLWFVFWVSLVFFAFGFFGISLVIRLFQGKCDRGRVGVLVDQQRLEQTMFVLWLLSAFIVLYNIAIQGLPPMFAFFGVDTEIYKGYGRWKGLLFPILMAIFLFTLFSDRRWLKVLLRCWSLAWLFLYISRGNVIVMCVQFLLTLFIMKRLRLRSVLIYGGAFLGLLMVMMAVVGEYRTGTDIFIKGMGIKKEYQDLYPGLLWVASYISLPLSNLVFIMEDFNEVLMGEFVFHRMLPAFSSEADILHDVLSSVPGVKDNTITYLGIVFMDFSWVGIVWINILLGVVGGMFYWTRFGLYFAPMFAVYLSQLVLLEFSYFYFTFGFMVENVILFLGVIYFCRRRWKKAARVGRLGWHRVNLISHRHKKPHRLIIGSTSE